MHLFCAFLWPRAVIPRQCTHCRGNPYPLLFILRKVLSEIDIASQFLSDCTLEEFTADELLKRAVCMTVINIGELVKSLSDDFRKQHTDIPWKEIAGFRDIAAHKYQTFRMDDVFETVRSEFPPLRQQLQALLDE